MWTVPWRLMRTVNEGVLRFFTTDRHETEARKLAHSAILWVVLGSLGWLWWRGGPSAEGLASVLASGVAAATGLALAAVALSLVTAYVWGPLLIVLWPFAALCLWPFGGWLAIVAPFVEVNVGWSPPGYSEAVLLTTGPEQGGLAHSASYQNREALAILVGWLRGPRPRAADDVALRSIRG